MSYTVKRGKLARRKWKEGDVVFISYGRDRYGQFWWVESTLPMEELSRVDITQLPHGGPFRTQAEAHRDSEIKTLGSQCEVAFGGQWDPAWDRPQ